MGLILVWVGLDFGTGRFWFRRGSVLVLVLADPC